MHKNQKRRGVYIMAMSEGRHSSHQSLIPAFKLFEDTLFRIVIPSAVLDLSCTQVRIT